MSASRQGTLLAAGFEGGSSWRVVRHAAEASARTAAADAAPAASAVTLQRMRCTDRVLPRSAHDQPHSTTLCPEWDSNPHALAGKGCLVSRSVDRHMFVEADGCPRVPGVGFEPTCPCGQSVLSRSRQPVAPPGLAGDVTPVGLVVSASHRLTSSANPSTATPTPGTPRCTSKWRCGPVASPVMPT